jgi:hypothetical protein
MLAPDTPIRGVVALLEQAIEDRDDGGGSASLLQNALAAISELIMAYDHTHTLDHVMNSFQYKWGSAALHDADPGDYSPALHRVVENISTAYTA